MSDPHATATVPDSCEAAGTCDVGGACDGCVLGGAVAADVAAGCGDGGRTSAEERRTVAASGVAITVVGAAVVGTGGTPAHLALALLAVVGGLVLAGLGGTAVVRGGARGDRLLGRATRLLPHVTGLLLLGLVVRVVTFVAGLT